MSSVLLSVRNTLNSNRHGWWVVLFIFVGLAVMFSARSSISLMMPIWEKEFSWTRSFVSGGGAMALIAMTLISPVAGNLLDRIGARVVICAALLLVGCALLLSSQMQTQWQFIALFCVIGGLGFGSLAAPQAATAVAQFFDENRGLATGIATSGVSGQVVLIPLLAAVVGWVGWRWSYMGFGILIIAMVPLAWMLITPPARRTASDDSVDAEASLSARLAMISRNRTFWLLMGGFVICGFTTTGVVEMHLIPYAEFCGFPRVESATAFGAISAATLAGMIVAGYLADKVHRPMLLGAIYFFRGLSFLILMNITGSSELLFLFAAMFGLFNYSTMPVLASIVATHVGLRVLGLTLGLLFAGHSAGAAAGVYMAGYFFDVFNSYQWVWIVSIALALMAALFSWLIPETRDTEGAPATAAA